MAETPEDRIRRMTRERQAAQQGGSPAPARTMEFVNGRDDVGPPMVMPHINGQSPPGSGVQLLGRPGVSMAPPTGDSTPDQMEAHPAVSQQRAAMSGANAAIASGSNQAFLNSMKVGVPSIAESGTFRRDEPVAPRPAPRMQEINAGPPRPTPQPQRPADPADGVRQLQQEVRPLVPNVTRPFTAPSAPAEAPAAPATRQYSVHGGRWTADGNATKYDPATGRVRIWIPGENRGLNVAYSSLDPESQKHVAASAPRGAVADLADGYDNREGVLHFDQQDPDEMQPAPQRAPAPRQAPAPAAPAAQQQAAEGPAAAGRPRAVSMPMQVWMTDDTGKHRFEGGVVAHDKKNSVVTIVGRDGVPRHVHESRLSPATIDYVNGINLPHTDAPLEGVQTANSRIRPPAKGQQRLRLTDGRFVDGQIKSHDPKSGAVNIQTPDGKVVSIEVDSLDETSRRQYDGRVAEHAERVQFDAEKKAYEDKMGPGSFEHRHGAVVRNGNQSVVIPPNTRVPPKKAGRPAAAPGKAPAGAVASPDAPPAAIPKAPVETVDPPSPDVPAAARQAAEDALQSDQERFRANAALRRSDTATRLRSGQGFSNVEQQGPLEDTGLTDEIMRNRAAADEQDRSQMRDMAEGQTRADKAISDKQKAADARSPELAENRKKWLESIQLYRQDGGLDGTGMTLDEYARRRGVVVEQVPFKNRRGAQNAANKLGDQQAREKNSRNAVRWQNMSDDARRDHAARVLDDPESTPQERAAAYWAVGDEESARNIERGLAGEKIAGAAAAPAEPPPPELPQVMDRALRSAPAGATVDQQIDIASTAIMREDNTQTAEAAQSMAAREVHRRAWDSARTAPVGSPAYAWLRRVANRLDDAGQQKPGTRPMTLMEFTASAFESGIPATEAARMHMRFVPQLYDGTQVGTNDTAAVE